MRGLPWRRCPVPSACAGRVAFLLHTLSRLNPQDTWPHPHHEGMFLPLTTPPLPPQEGNFPEQFRAVTALPFPLPQDPPAQLTGSICYPCTWLMAQALALWRRLWLATLGFRSPELSHTVATFPPWPTSAFVRVKLCFLHHLPAQSWAPLSPMLQD